MTVRDLYHLLDSVAPFDTQEDFDNSGLLLGDPEARVAGILFALDVTRPVIEEAVSLGANLIVTHHPLMFSPLRRLTEDDYEGRLLSLLIRRRLNLISAHTNLDRAPGGINDALAESCGLSEISGEGFFRCGFLPRAMTGVELTAWLSDRLSCVVRPMGSLDILVRKLGVSSGAGGGEWTAAAAAGCEAFLSGEIKHHLALAMADSGLLALECGHFATEEPGIRALAAALQKALDAVEWKMRIFISSVSAYAFPMKP